MPALDLSFVLGLPFFADDTGTLYLTRASREVNEYGESVETFAPQVPLDGVVQPASDLMLKLLPDGAKVEGAITLYTRARLYALTTTEAPDRIEWKGQAFQVAAIADWTDYGAGFTAALCTLTDFTQTPLDD